ncbi:MAG: TlpA disulfide reductase family protein [Acidobacteriota bacterium]
MQTTIRKRAMIALPIVAILSLALLYYFVKIKPMMRAGREQGQYIDAASRRRVSEFRFEMKDGARAVSDYRGKVLLIDVWATWCGPCVGSIPHLARLGEKYREKGFELVALSVDKGRWSDVDPFVEKRADINYSLAVPVGETDVYFKTLIDLNPLGDVAALPTAFLIDSEGRLAGKFVGAGRYEEIESRIAKLIDEAASS